MVYSCGNDGEIFPNEGITEILVNKSYNYKIMENDSIEQEFKNVVDKIRGDGKTRKIDVDEITNFDWDTMLVITPYTPFNHLNFMNKVDLSELKQTGITMNDGANVLAFIKGNQLVAFTEISRLNGDFDYYDSVRIYTPMSAIFDAVRTKKIFVGGKEKSLSI